GGSSSVRRGEDPIVETDLAHDGGEARAPPREIEPSLAERIPGGPRLTLGGCPFERVEESRGVSETGEQCRAPQCGEAIWMRLRLQGAQHLTRARRFTHFRAQCGRAYVPDVQSDVPSQ